MRVGGEKGDFTIGHTVGAVFGKHGGVVDQTNGKRSLCPPARGGSVEVMPDASNRRCRLVVLTLSGIECWQSAVQGMRSREFAALDAVDPADRDACIRAAEAFCDCMEQVATRRIKRR